jgi:hypothetical protein
MSKMPRLNGIYYNADFVVISILEISRLNKSLFFASMYNNHAANKWYADAVNMMLMGGRTVMVEFQVDLLNSFDLSPQQRSKLKGYYLLHWQFEYLIRKLNEDGTISHAGVRYIPIWKDSYIELNLQKQMKLSFRHYDLDPEGFNYVLIKAA